MEQQHANTDAIMDSNAMSLVCSGSARGFSDWIIHLTESTVCSTWMEQKSNLSADYKISTKLNLEHQPMSLACRLW